MPVGAAIGGSAALGAYSASQDRKSAEKSVEKQTAQRDKSLEFIERMQNQARDDIFELYPSAQESRQAGIESGLDLYSQALPTQMDAFQQGNVGAQQALTQGNQQVQNAILGNPVDMSQMQPQRIDPQGIQGLMNVQAPQTQGIDQLFQQQQQPQPQQQPGQQYPSGQQFMDDFFGRNQDPKDGQEFLANMPRWF